MEMLAGIGVAVVAAVMACVVQHADDSHFRPHPQDLLQIIFLPWLLVQGTCEILWVAMRDLFGGRKAVSAFRLLTFETGNARDPHSTARLVLAVIYTTMTPTSVVLGINVRDRQMLFHQIQRSGIPKLLKNLGARA